jgi:hypothetical protein
VLLSVVATRAWITEVEVPTNIATGVPTNNTYQNLRSEGRLDCRNIVEACRVPRLAEAFINI